MKRARDGDPALPEDEEEEEEEAAEPAPKRSRSSGPRPEPIVLDDDDDDEEDEPLPTAPLPVPITSVLSGAPARLPTLEDVEGRFLVDVAVANARPERDRRVTFVDETHTTYLDGDLKRPMGGVTNTINTKFFVEFDEERVAEDLAERGAPDYKGTRPIKGPYKGKTKVQIRGGWKDKRDAGTAQHAGKELILRGLPLTDEQRRQHVTVGFLKFLVDHPSLVPYQLERRIFNEKAWLAGAFDALFLRNATTTRKILLDWKHCKLRKFVPNASMERVMIDAGVLVGPVYYSDREAREKEEEDAAALALQHKERATMVKEKKKEKKDASENHKLDDMWAAGEAADLDDDERAETLASQWSKAKAAAGGDLEQARLIMASQKKSSPPSPAADQKDELPPLDDIPSWWKKQKPRSYGPHPLTAHLPAESIVEYALQLNFYQGMLEEEAEEEGWPDPEIEERWLVNFPPERPNEYELYKIRRIDHRPFFARLPWDEGSPLHLAIDPARDLCLDPIAPCDRGWMGEGPTRVMVIKPGPAIPGYLWVGGAFAKGAYQRFPLVSTEWDIPPYMKSYLKNPLKDPKTGKIKETELKEEEVRAYRKWTEALALQARRYESHLLQSRGLVSQLVGRLGGRVLLCFCRTDVEEKYCHAQILARYANALLAKRLEIKEVDGPMDRFVQT